MTLVEPLPSVCPAHHCSAHFVCRIPAEPGNVITVRGEAASLEKDSQRPKGPSWVWGSKCSLNRVCTMTFSLLAGAVAGCRFSSRCLQPGICTLDLPAPRGRWIVGSYVRVLCCSMAIRRVFAPVSSVFSRLKSWLDYAFHRCKRGAMLGLLWEM
jgi:hypothetical protein